MTARFTTNATGDEALPGKVTFTALTPTKQQSSSNNGDGSNNNTSTSGSTDKSRGNYRVLIKADNYNERLRTGMSSKITIVTAEAKGVLAVPNECLSNDNDGNTILKVTTDGGATSQEVVVTTGLSDGSFTEVSGDGITEGTQLVIPQMAEVSEEMPELY
jgi:multidrug efflux pump subunit AcrA (membrane-fusion protein)